MPMPTPLIPPPEYQEEIKRRFTVNSRSQTGLDKDGHELCLTPYEWKYNSYGDGRKYKRHNKQRYYRVSVTVNGKRKFFRAHNIVIWLTYGFDAIKPGFCVNHKNGNGTDNRLVNLEVIPVAENAASPRKPHQQPRKALTKHKPRWMLMPCSGEKSRRIIGSKIYFLRTATIL
ncbi:HNH endonuclease [Escherichia coli]|uniref:HNH endonuclease n=1 Tax=Escherichia coli TaxID=562 RepID=UPI000DE0354C|nr:HNH endonuclease [Escherichia coli]MBS0117914.1 HNH endonuclease [Escherichia coli]MCK2676627.1 HNH endonuclease [Escherichia coli]